MSEVAVSVGSNQKVGKMTYKYNPTVTDMRQAWEVAYGDYGVNLLVGAMFVNIDDAIKERLYKQALEQVKADLEERGIA